MQHDITLEEIRAHLELLLASPEFVNAPKLRDLLQYIVQATLEGRGGALKAYTIGTEVFGLGDDFDPGINPVVRTEARRLRSKLDQYYLEHLDSPLRVSIPKGNYLAQFSRGEPVDKAAGNPQEQLDRVRILFESKGTILVLAFENIGGGPEADRFARGLLKMVSASLSRAYDLNVIDYDFFTALSVLGADAGGGANFRESGNEEKLRSLSEEYNARFILSGSVQMEGERLRLLPVLRDTSTNYNIWTEKFDYDLKQISGFDLQDEIAEAIAYRLAGEFGVISRTLLAEYTSRKNPCSLEDEATILCTRWAALLTREALREALMVVEKAVATYPDSIWLLPKLADLYAADYRFNFNLVENALEKSLQLASKALIHEPHSQFAAEMMAVNYFLRNDRDKFVEYAERAISVNPWSGLILTALGSCYGLLGMWKRALELLSKVQALSPSIPFWCNNTLAMYHYFQDDFERALTEVDRLNMPDVPQKPLLRLVCAAELGLAEMVRDTWRDLHVNFPEYRENRLNALRRVTPHEEYVKRFAQGIAKAESFLG